MPGILISSTRYEDANPPPMQRFPSHPGITMEPDCLQATAKTARTIAQAVNLALDDCLNEDGESVKLAAFSLDAREIRHLTLITCEHAILAGLLVKQRFAQLAGLSIDLLRELTIDTAPAPDDAQSVTLSLRQLLDQTAMTSMPGHRESRARHPVVCPAGKETVAAHNTMPETFSQFTWLAMLAIRIGRSRNRLHAIEEKLEIAEIRHFIGEIQNPGFIASLNTAIAQSLAGRREAHCLLGGVMLEATDAVASYLHRTCDVAATAICLHRFRREPRDMPRDHVPAIVVAASDHLSPDVLRVIREMASSGSDITLLSDPAGIEKAGPYISHAIPAPVVGPLLTPLLHLLLLQCIACRIDRVTVSGSGNESRSY